jgi:hypothetical protein
MLCSSKNAKVGEYLVINGNFIAKLIAAGRKATSFVNDVVSATASSQSIVMADVYQLYIQFIRWRVT